MHVPFNALGRQTEVVRPRIDAALARVLDSGWYVHGPEHAAFETEFAEYCGVSHCVGVGNGTDALELCLRAAGCGVGDEVITVANAGMYTSTACFQVGATPVYVDVEESSHEVDVGAVLEALSPATRAVVVTHLYGQLADVERIVADVRPHGVLVIEDCSQAHGAIRNGTRAGAFADMAAFSFYPTKNLGALGDGGAVVTCDDDIAECVKRLRQYGWDRRYHAASPYGRNSRLDEMQAAILRVKLGLLDEWNQRRRAIATQYREATANTDLRLLHEPSESYVAHLCVGVHPARDDLRAALDTAGIDTAVHFPTPDHMQPAIAVRSWKSSGLAVTERAAQSAFSLPCFPELTDAEVCYVCEALRSVL